MTNIQRRNRRPTRKQQQDRMGIALCALCFFIMSGWLYGCYQIDKANGVSVSQSLASVGL